STVLCAAMLRLSRRYGLLDRAGGQLHKRHTRAVPNTGGVAIYVAIVVPMAAVLLAVWQLPWAWLDRIYPVQDLLLHVPGLKQTTAIGGGIIVGLSLVHLMGLLDDRRPLGPYVKLFYHTVVAFMLVMLADIRVLHLLDDYGPWGSVLSVVAS